MDDRYCSQCENPSFPDSYSESSTLHTFRKKFFHDSCTVCDSEDNNAVQLCEVCKHLRLQHLTCCSRSVEQNGPCPDTLVSELDGPGKVGANIEVRLGTFNEMKARSNCKLCSEIAKLIIFRLQSQEFNEDSWDKYVVTMEVWPNFYSSNPALQVWLKHATNGQFDKKILLAPSHSPGSKPTDPIESKSKKPIDWNQIESWVQESVAKYGCEFKRCLILPEEFRVIDVLKNKVILASGYCEYVALSYVWGVATGDLMLCVDNVRQLAEDFAISRDNLPSTILDAMIICAKIGKRYLWVDRLCIVQDGREDYKQAQIESMGDIYSSAFFTIVAACGQDARSGLAGIDGKPRLRAPWVIHLNKSILTERVSNPFESRPEDRCEVIPKWYTRGWTYQELMLSSRLLIFTELGVCYEYTYNAESFVTFEFTPLGLEGILRGTFESSDIRHMILEYAERHLSYNTDTFRAISGIFSHLGIFHQSGMPWKDFDKNLFWRPISWQQNSRTHDISGTVLFPSWSWGSVIGPIEFKTVDHMPVTAWAHFSGEGNNFTILSREKLSGDSDILRERLSGNSDGWHQLAHREGFFSLECSANLHDRQYKECCEECCGTDAQKCTLSKTPDFVKKFSDDDINAAVMPGRLLLLTQTTKLRLEYIHGSNGISATEFFLWDEKTQLTGVLQLSTCNAEPVIQILKACPTAFFDFAAISICDSSTGLGLLHGFWNKYKSYIVQNETYPPRKGKDNLFRESRGTVPDWQTFFREVTYEGYSYQYKLPVLNVMLLGWRGNVAHRIGLGQVWLRRWVQSKPKSRAIVLE